MAYSGPWPLTNAAIDNMVPKGTPGTYYIGRVDDEKKFLYVKIGRDDVCVNTRLKSYVKNAEFAKWRYFKFQKWATAREAFEEESRVFHDARGLKNLIHPARPDGQNIHCPVSRECFPDAEDEEDAG
jgi:hypothetical protein